MLVRKVKHESCERFCDAFLARIVKYVSMDLNLSIAAIMPSTGAWWVVIPLCPACPYVSVGVAAVGVVVERNSYEWISEGWRLATPYLESRISGFE